MALWGFDYPGGILGMNDFTCGVLLKLVWTIYISAEDVSIPSMQSYHPDSHLLHHGYWGHLLLHVDNQL